MSNTVNTVLSVNGQPYVEGMTFDTGDSPVVSIELTTRAAVVMFDENVLNPNRHELLHPNRHEVCFIYELKFPDIEVLDIDGLSPIGVKNLFNKSEMWTDKVIFPSDIKSVEEADEFIDKEFKEAMYTHFSKSLKTLRLL
jgi:hypothetical protein